jgi:hypothetical protein
MLRFERFIENRPAVFYDMTDTSTHGVSSLNFECWRRAIAKATMDWPGEGALTGRFVLSGFFCFVQI